MCLWVSMLPYIGDFNLQFDPPCFVVKEINCQWRVTHVKRLGERRRALRFNLIIKKGAGKEVFLAPGQDALDLCFQETELDQMGLRPRHLRGN